MASRDVIEKERNLIRKMIEEFNTNKFEFQNEEQKERIRQYLASIVELESGEMGYKTEVVREDKEDKVTSEKLRKCKEEGSILLAFSKVSDFSFLTPVLIDDSRVFKLGLSEKKLYDSFQNLSPDKASMYAILVVMHELRHMKQHLMMSTGRSSYEGLISAKEYLIITDLHDLYGNNHDSMFIEEDADIEATKRALELFNEEVYAGKRHTILCDMGIIKGTRNDLVSDSVDELIRNGHSIDALVDYPILNKEYNADGSKKTIAQLIQNMQAELKEISDIESMNDEEKAVLTNDCKSMYFEIIYRSIERNPRKGMTELTAVYNNDERKAFFEDMIACFKQRLDEELYNVKTYLCWNSLEEEKNEVELREGYYQKRIELLKELQVQPQKESFLESIINRGKSFVRTGRLSALAKKSRTKEDNRISEK